MRTFEKPERYKIEEKTENEEHAYEELGRRVGGDRVGLIDNDITNDLLGSIVYKKMLKDYGVKAKKPKGKGLQMSGKQALGVILSLIIAGMLLYQVFKTEIGDALQKKAGEMLFEDGSRFENVVYFGKEALIKTVVSQITKMVYLLRTFPERELQKTIEGTQKNFLFHGPPGTGKTLLMMRLVYQVDLNIKFLALRQELGEERFNKLEQYEKERMAGSMEPKVRIVFIKPSVLNSKYVGETEKNISSLFAAAAKSKKYWATFIFIDEMDVFFSERTSTSQDYNIKSQTEFLNLIGGACDNLKTPVFLFGATNRFDVLDEAFKRRFSSIYKFGLPNEEERLDILRNHLDGCNNEIRANIWRLVGPSSGMSQARMVDILKRMAFSHDGDAGRFDWKDLETRFVEADPKKKGMDGTEVAVDPRLERFYYLEPEFPKTAEEIRPE